MKGCDFLTFLGILTSLLRQAVTIQSFICMPNSEIVGFPYEPVICVPLVISSGKWEM